MKNTAKILLPIFASALIIFTACEKIDEPDRLVPVDPGELPTTDRSVLVVEFTGQMCTNCPTGATTIHNLQEVYPGKIIPVSMHPEGIYFTTWTNKRGKVDLTCAQANVYYNYFGNPSMFPCISADFGAVNNVIDNWGSTIIEKMNRPTSLKVDDITARFDESSRKVKIDYSFEAIQYVAPGVAVMVWITENGIVGGQIDGGRPVYNYVHNHVLRAAVNGDWGVASENPLSAKEKLTGSYSYEIPRTWNADNCEAVVFVITPDKKVLQAGFAQFTSK